MYLMMRTLCSLGMLLSALFSDLASSMQLAIGSFYPNLLLSGKFKIIITIIIIIVLF